MMPIWYHAARGLTGVPADPDHRAVPTSAHFLGFALASLLILAVPGPSIMFTIGRALSVGRGEALLSVVGNALGILTQICGIALGLGPVLARSAIAYEVIRIGGALYLLWLGIQAIRTRREVAEALAAGVPDVRPSFHALRTGYVVGVTNPKTIVFFSALLPQFIGTDRPVWSQIAVLGLVFAVLAVLCDGSIALAASRARQWFVTSPRRLQRVGGLGGLMMLGLGAGVLLTGRRD